MTKTVPVLYLVGALMLCAAPALAQNTNDNTPYFRVGPPEESVQSASPAAPAMSPVKAIILGAVEGITEYLPVSSTGHLLVAQRLLGLDKTAESRSASDAYAICIQLGAILAVFVISFRRIKQMVVGIAGRDPQGLKMAANLVVAFVPAAAIGLLFEDRVKQYLYDPLHIAIAWVVGGLFILVAMRKRGSDGGLSTEQLTWQKALIIGIAQAIALWPGVSRSLVTMAGGMLLGLSVASAVEFSFLLGLVTLGAGTLYELARRGHEIISAFGWLSPAIGMLVAAVTAFLAVKWMISYLSKNSPQVFGWYRIVLGVFVFALMFRGYV